MVKRAISMAFIIALISAAPISAATSRHVFVDVLDSNLCLVTHSETWTALVGQATLRLTFTDLTTGGSEGYDVSLDSTDHSFGTSNLVGNTGSPGLGHVWRLSAQILDGSDNVLAKGKQRAIIDCEITPA